MLDRIAADAVLIVHLAFIVFVVAGGLLALRWRWAPCVHVPAALWGGYVELAGRICPLTWMENSLRRRAGEAGYAESFIDHYLVAIIYPEGLTPEMQAGLGVAVVVVNAAVYGWVWGRKP